MGYSLQTVETLLSQIKTLAPGLSIIRTDHLEANDYFAAKHEVTLEFQQRKVTIGLSGNPEDNDIAIREIRKTNSMPLQSAIDLLAQVDALGVLNPRGNWVLRSSTSGDRGHHATIEPGSVDHPYFVDALHDLREALPGCSAIESVSVRQGMAAGHVKRRVLLRVFGLEGEELAALDAAHFGVHIESLMTAMGQHAQRNNRRAHDWAKQLGIEPIDLPAVLHDLMLVFVYLPIPRVDINPLSTVDAFWRRHSPAE